MELNPIAISLSPNNQSDDVWTALKILIKPWQWQNGQSIRKVESWFGKFLKNYHIYSFSSGRYALYCLLKAFGLGKGDEVILQAFTCVAVVDPIIWAGAKPIYSDIDDTLNIDPELLEKHITSKTKAIIVQHTFGIPANMKLINKIAQKHNLILIEDCAHSLGSSINNTKIGTMGDASIFSFGRDKIISSVFGGLAALHSKHKLQNNRMRTIHTYLKHPSFGWIFQQILHPLSMSLILPLYNWGPGKLILVSLQKLNLLSKPIAEIEKHGGKPDVYEAKYPNALAYILLHKLRKLSDYNNKRRRFSEIYFRELKKLKNIKLPPNLKGAVYLRFNILCKSSRSLIKKARSNNIILGNWYKNTIDPEGVSLSKVHYIKGTCPRAELCADESVNLPTYPRLNSAQLVKIIKFISANSNL